ncbi:methylmalonic aciduria and homocystinuria type D protein [Argonema galeatum]|uniref:methylmalonic aciduria and homocystinuria type D protein n=1 Tax=Argonema galeatum TaxID=2942762 RepID=UPI002013AC36|nr:methylmalonic aciduria and homocystinuria type D protein [Argonema galeatum]MCL1466258.1 methylmalonic aciduria and homocystinuria type D protein [Argonema galeatum A003/A1]
MTSPKVYTFQQSSPIELVTETGQEVQISIHQPSSFMSKNLERVLPDWTLPVAWVVVVLQQSRFALGETATHIEREKDRLRERFMRFGCTVVSHLRDQGFLADLIDPRDGYPWLSRRGEIPHDDTAVVTALLGFPVTTGNCSIITHPSWGNAVYPSILMSSASPQFIKPALKKEAIQQGWKDPTKYLQLSLPGVLQ